MPDIGHLLFDTDVVAAGVMSATGASRYLLESIGLGALPAAASVPLFLDYEAVLKREETLRRAGASPDDIDAILDQLAALLVRVDIWYLWRPQLRDADDDMVLEAAPNAGATHIVTFNLQDFGTAPMRFGIETCRPADIAQAALGPGTRDAISMSKSNYPLKAPASISPRPAAPPRATASV
jgi:predicted nucleic acid-binding protein